MTASPKKLNCPSQDADYMTDPLKGVSLVRISSGLLTLVK